MDTLSHFGWGYAVSYGKRMAWWGALAGAMPDLLFFIPSKIEHLIEYGWAGLRFGSEPGIWRADGPPLPPPLLEAYFRYYVWTHSLVVLAVATAIVWLAPRVAAARRGARRPGRARPSAGVSWIWLAVPYGLHIVMDVPTHERYPTRILHPLSDWSMTGLSWGDPRIFWPNVIALLLAVWIVQRRRSAMAVRAQR